MFDDVLFYINTAFIVHCDIVDIIPVKNPPLWYILGHQDLNVRFHAEKCLWSREKYE